MKNKTVIRKKTENGKFTTIHNSILYDTRLLPNAFRLLTAILSDSDTQFDLSQTLYCDRLGITKKTFFKAITNLEECGYIRKKEIENDVTIPKIKKANSNKKVYHYTISEYGNLNSESQQELKIQQDSNHKNINFEDKETLEQQCRNFILANSEKIKKSQFLFDKTINAFEDGVYDINYYQNLLDEEKEIEKALKLFYKEALSWIENIIRPERPKAETEFKEWLKTEIFTNRNINLDSITVRSKYSKLALIKYKPKQKTDYETEMFDYYENPED